MAAVVRYRNVRTEARERARFRVLEHVRGLVAGDLTRPVLCCRVADELGLLRLDAADLIQELIGSGLLADAGAGPSIRLTPGGAWFIERQAGRRRSVRGALRPPSSDLTPRPLWRRVLGARE